MRMHRASYAGDFRAHRVELVRAGRTSLRRAAITSDVIGVRHNRLYSLAVAPPIRWRLPSRSYHV
jgi:hypothetical protein